MNDSPTNSDLSAPRPDTDDAFMLRVARVLSNLRRETIYADLTQAATELLGTNIAIVGLFTEVKAVASIETLARVVDGELQTSLTYPIAGTPCETVVGEAFRFYSDDLARLFPDSDAHDEGVRGYAGFPMYDDNGEQLGIFSVMSFGELKDPVRTESVLRIFAARAGSEYLRGRSEQELAASEERYRSIFNAAVDGLALLSPEGRIIDVNSAIERMYGYSREEMIGEKALRFARGPSRENAARFLEAVRNNNYADMVDKARHRDGSEFYIEPRGVTVEYRNRRHILAIIRDVTERQQAEQQRTMLEAQLRQAQKMEAIGHLSGGVAHDFNNILTTVLGYLELAHEHVERFDDDRLNRYLERAQRSGERARDLIQQMLTFSRGQHGEPRPLSVRPVVESAVTLLTSMLPSTIHIVTDLADDLPRITQDPVLLEQILVNLCLNARDAMGDGGTLSIRLNEIAVEPTPCTSCHQDCCGSFVELVVKDSGTGISSDVIERMFEPFFTTKEAGQSSGMGLSTVHGILHEHGGHILVHSENGIGTEMQVLLPLANEAIVEEARVVVAADNEVRPKTLSGTVLLVDDNAEVAEFVTDLLGDWGLDVEAFSDAKRALANFGAHAQRYDLGLMDQKLPGVSGTELTELLRSKREDFPVVLYSGYNDVEDDAKAIEFGAFAVIRKPIDIEELRSLVQDILLPNNA